MVPIKFTREKDYLNLIIDETIILIGNEHLWLWICIEPVQRSVLGIHISEEKMLVAENFVSSLVSKYERHTVFTDRGTWYPQACNFLHIKHDSIILLRKALLEVIQYIKN